MTSTPKEGGGGGGLLTKHKNSDVGLEDAAVAASTALVGEAVLDAPRKLKQQQQETSSSPSSPSQQHLHRGDSTASSNNSTTTFDVNGMAAAAPEASTTTSTASSASQSSSSALVTTLDSCAEALTNGLIMATGFSWVRKQQERRQRQYLQDQAQAQLRKIQEAQRAEAAAQAENVGGRSLMDNPIFQNITGQRRRTSSSGDADAQLHQQYDDEETDPELDPKCCSSSSYNATSTLDENRKEIAFVSKSGDGYSVEFDHAAAAEEDQDGSPIIEDEDAAYVPPVRIDPDEKDALEGTINPYILKPNQMQQIAQSVLPRGIAYCRWKRLYSLVRDGDSFDACLRYIHNAAQTLMVIRTSRNAVLGGFGDMAWSTRTHGGARYFGGSQSCLFRVHPRTGNVECYKWTGANRYIQLCDPSNKMLAFGGGGQEGAFGLCVEKDFQLGSTGHCATFDNDPLCDQENFEIIDMEIFGFLIGQF